VKKGKRSSLLKMTEKGKIRGPCGVGLEPQKKKINQKALIKFKEYTRLRPAIHATGPGRRGVQTGH